MKLPRKRGCPIQKLPEPYRTRALELWHFFCERRRRERGSLEPWYYARAAGIAKRLALHPFTPSDGRRLRAVRGGRATQRLLHQQGRQPMVARNASAVGAARRAFYARKRRLQRQGIEPVRSSFCDMRGI